MIYGTDYYPEHWPEERWETDLKLMKEAGINTIRVAEFAWTLMEPSEGNFDFAWLDAVVSLAEKYGIKIVMCTPTATPPKWLMDKHPEIYPVDEYGHVRGFGSRRHYCFNSPVFTDYSKKIIRAMARQYKDNKNIIAWQLDNEFGCHNTVRCYCEDCSTAFSGWLESKYKTIGNLNEKLGLAFWSQQYDSFESVVLPAHTVCDYKEGGMYAHNPGLFLDYCRFASDSVFNYSQMQISELRANGVSTPITHNFMGSFYDIDYFKLSKQFEFISWDCYPNIAHGPFSGLMEVSFNHDKLRGYNNRKFWVMEQCSGQNGWNFMHATPEPGEIRLWAYQAAAHGANGIVFFRWRPCLFGTEQYWHGILDHDGIPRQRYEEIKQTGTEMQLISDVIDNTDVVSEACVLHSFDNMWSHTYQWHSEGFDYNKLLYTAHNSIIANNINCDVRDINADLSPYKLVVMPAYNISSEKDAEKLSDYVKNGGHLVITFRSGNRDEFNKINGLTLPGYFRDLCGIDVINYDPVGTVSRSASGMTGKFTADVWCDVIDGKDTTVLAEYTDGFYKGSPCITVNKYGKGYVYYIGCNMKIDDLTMLYGFICGKAGVERCCLRPVPGVETILRKGDAGEYIFAMNHTDSAVYIPIENILTDRISGISHTGSIRLEPYGVAVLY
ncbi:MAG: beta-galactosidase [Clostridia bacterium]|nr:beta-galactosidase [Clostridia bacterium]